MSEIDWSLLPRDELEAISKFLTFDPDYVRFRSVCSSWRKSAPNRPLPWLIGHRKDEDGNHTIFGFFKLSLLQGASEISAIPELPETSFFDGMQCIGSSYGWIALTSLASESIVLFNPLTESRIDIPKPPNCDHHYKLILSADPATSVEYIAYCNFSYYRAGDAAWTPFQCPDLSDGWGVESCYHRGHFYLASYNDVTRIYVCDFVPEPRVRRIASVKSKNIGLPTIDQAHLIESNGDLLLVLGYCHLPQNGRFIFMVYKVELGEPLKLVRLQSLGDRALFLRPQNAFSLAASRFPGCRENSIYYFWFPDDFGLLDAAATKLKVYNLTDWSDVFVSDGAVVFQGDWKPCAWFIPNFLAVRTPDEEMLG